MAKLKALTQSSNQKEIFINPDQVVALRETPGGGNTEVITTSSINFVVNGLPSKVRELLDS